MMGTLHNPPRRVTLSPCKQALRAIDPTHDNICLTKSHTAFLSKRERVEFCSTSASGIL